MRSIIVTGILSLVLGVSIAQNTKPKVIPSLKEWTGSTGNYTLAGTNKICINPADYSTLTLQANAFRADLIDAFFLSLTVVSTATPNNGDIFLKIDTTDNLMGDEGYLIEIKDVLTIKAKTARGVIFGTRTILQILKQDNGNNNVPKGTIRDYPSFPIRGFMIDVGRMPITMKWLRDCVKFMSYYKMGDLHIHLNDNDLTGINGYKGFRIECSTYPGLTSKDLFYTKQEYKDLHALAKVYGVTIVSEFDTPAHAGAITKLRPDLKHPNMAYDHLDLGNPNIYPFMDALWDEYKDIFEAVHIGTDEYNGGVAADFKKYVNYYNKFLKARGFNPVRMWGSQATQGGASGFDKDFLVNIWYGGYYNPQTAINDGYNIINTSDVWYIVPEAGYYNDYLSVSNVYNNYAANKCSGATVDINSPRLKGGSFCVWNDVWSTKKYTEQQVQDRLKGVMQAFSQKLWSKSSPELTFTQFTTLYQLLGTGPVTTNFVSNNEIIKESFKVFPNPSNGSFTVELNEDNATGASVRWFDIMGREMNFNPSSTISDSNQIKEIYQNIPKGFYLIRVMIDDQNYQTSKVVVE